MRKSAEKMNKAVDKFIYCADFKGVISGVFNRNAFNLVPLLKVILRHMVQSIHIIYQTKLT